MVLTQLLNLIQQNGITPDQFFIMYTIKEQLPFSKALFIKESHALLMGGFTEEKNVNDSIKITLLPKGVKILDEAESLFKSKKKGTPAQILGQGYQQKIQEYLELFPKIKLPSGKAARSDKKNVETAFAWFMSNYDYSWDIILKATESYVAEYELKNYLYMQTSQYFIRKQLSDKTWGSELANRCSEISTGSVINTENHFKDRVV